MIPFNSSLLRNLSLPFLISTLIGCNSLGNAFPFANQPVIPIEQIPQQQLDSTIYLQGKVRGQAPFLDSGAYQLQDHTGAVWVRTNQSIPQLGQEIAIKGQVEYQSIPVGAQEMGEFYILELEQVARQNPTSEPSQPANKPAKTPVEDLLLPHKQQQKP